MSKTIEFFKELSKIPRESGNEEKIADYIVEFAKSRNLEYLRDSYNNVIIKKYENEEKIIILGAHLDMVCEKNIDKEFDFKKDSIEVYEENGYLKANGTTLGADNGIGVAVILNILDSNYDVSIEAVFTTMEETTMEGAEKIDLSSLKGKKMINLDGFDADTILIESASFTDIDIKMNYVMKEKINDLYKITLSGLEGGHSGFDINKNRGNSIKILSELLLKISDIKISSLIGGTKINVIPSMAMALFSTNIKIDDIVKEFELKKRVEFPKLVIKLEKVSLKNNSLNTIDSERLLKSIINFKHGIFSVNNRNEVTTSENLSLVNLEKNLIQVGLRSSNLEERENVLEYLNNYCKEYDYNLIIKGYQPGFRTLEDCDLVKELINSYQKIDGNKPNLKSVHIGVEVGLLKEKINDLEVAIISPKILDAHSPNERVEIESINKCDEWLNNFLSDYN